MNNTTDIMMSQSWRLLMSVGFWLLMLLSSQPVYGDESSEGMIHVRLREQVEVTRSRIRLSELAECVTPTPVCDEFYGVDVGPSPAPGRMTLVRVEDLQKILHVEFGDRLFAFDKSSVIRVTAAATDADVEGIHRRLQQTLDELLGMEENLRAVVVNIHMSTLGKVRQGFTRIRFPEIDALTGDPRLYLVAHLMGNVPLKVELSREDDEHETQNLWVRAQIEVEQNLPTVTQDVEANKILKEELLTMQWQKLSRTRQNYVGSFADLIGKRVRNHVQMGSPISMTNVSAQFAIKRGATVNAEILRAGMRVQSKVKALNNAAVGDQLDVVVIGSGRKLTGVVRNADLVEVNL